MERDRARNKPSSSSSAKNVRDERRRAGDNRSFGEASGTTNPTVANPPVQEEEEEEDFYLRDARENRVDNRTGRRTRRRSGPGPPTDESREPADLSALLRNAASIRERESRGIPRYRMTPAFAVRADGTLPPEALSAIAKYNPGALERLQKNIMANLAPVLNTFVRKLQESGTAGGFLTLSESDDTIITTVNEADKDFLSQLICHVCMEINEPPIFFCKNEHAICSNCQGKLCATNQNSSFGSACPYCREAGIPEVRKFEIEKRLMATRLRCGYTHFGCETTVLVSELKKHHSSCIFRKWTCSFCSATINLATYDFHFKTKHDLDFESMHEHISVAENLTKFTLPLEEYRNGLSFALLTIAGEDYVLCQLEWESKKFLYFVFKMDSVEGIKGFTGGIRIRQKSKLRPNDRANKMGVDDENAWHNKTWLIPIVSGQQNLLNILESLYKEKPGTLVKAMPHVDLNEELARDPQALIELVVRILPPKNDQISTGANRRPKKKNAKSNLPMQLEDGNSWEVCVELNH